MSQVEGGKHHTGDWAWLADTYWYCPAPDLPALIYGTDGALAAIDDQTVWHVTGSRGGYFWGRGAVLLSSPAQPPRLERRVGMTFVGSIAPSNQVHVTFLVGKAAPTVGIGVVDDTPRKRHFVMQMSSATLSGLVVHWARMLQVREGDPEWTDVPGVGASVEALLAGLAPPQAPPVAGG